MIVRRLTTAGIVAAMVACSRVREVYEPARFISEKNPPVVYVTQRNGAVVTLANPRVSGDTVLGVLLAENRAVAMPFSQVHSVAAVRFDGARTALVAAGIALTSALAAHAFFGTANGKNNWYCDYTSSTRGSAGEPVCGPT